MLQGLGEKGLSNVKSFLEGFRGKPIHGPKSEPIETPSVCL